MKKLVIGALVGGILVFLWQTLSWTVLDLHAKEYQVAPAEGAIMDVLNAQLKEDGQYRLPGLDRHASTEERKKFMEATDGKPWAIVSYHKAYTTDMVTTIVKGFVAALIAALFVCYVLSTNPNRTFGGIFISTILIGLAGYLFIPFADHIWWEKPGAITNLIDVLISWGLCGLWLGWYLKRK
jgi:hypothetical protein